VVILEVLGAFWKFLEYFGHLLCILVVLAVLRVFWSFERFWGILEVFYFSNSHE